MSSTRSIVSLSVVVLVIATINIDFAEAQFMAHRIWRRQDRTLQKLLKELMELELPIPTRERNPSLSKVRAQALGLNPKKKFDSHIENSVDSMEYRSGNSNTKNGCNPSSSEFNHDGFGCVCSRLATGKVICYEHSSALNRGLDDKSDNSDVLRMLNNFEKLVDQLSTRATPIG